MINIHMLKVRDYLFLFICLSIPFICIPKTLNKIGFLGGPISTQLILYPMLLLFAFTAFAIFKKKNVTFPYWRTIRKFLCIYLCILLISAIYGIIIFPYNDLLLNGNNISVKKMSVLIDLLTAYGIFFDKNQLANIWVVTRAVKNVIFQCIYTFLFSYLIFCWYKDNSHRALKVLLCSIRIISTGIIIYAIIEIFYYMGIDIARKILIVTNPLFYDIGVGMGWWPPLFWLPARLRSFFPEPSFLGMYIAFALPFLWTSYINGKTKSFDIFLIFSLEVICFLTYSKTSVLLSLGECILFFILCIYCKNRKYIVNSIIFVLVFICAFGSSAVIGERFQNSSIQLDGALEMEYAKKYLNSNVKGVVNIDSGSNNSRFAVIKSELRVWERYPWLGVGIANRQCYIADFLTPQEKEIGELANCIQYQQKLGILKSGFPAPCEYSADLAELGIIGTLIKLFPFILLSIILGKYHNGIRKSSDNLLFIMVIVAMSGCLANGFSNHLTVIYTTWILLGIIFAMLCTVREQKYDI